MNTYLENPESKMTRSLLRDEEKAAVKRIAQERFADNPNDGPVLGYGSAYEMAEISRGYNVDTFRMSRSEFYQFCVAVAEGRTVADATKESSVDYPWRVLTHEYSTEDQIAVLKVAVTTGIARTTGKKVITRSKQLTDATREITFDQKYLTDQSISYLSGIEGLESTDFLYNTTRQVVSDTAAHQGEVTDRTSDPTTKLISALDCNLRSSGYWGKHGEAGLTAVKDPARLDYFMTRVNELQNWADAIGAKDGRMDGYNAGKIIEMVKMINVLTTLPPHTEDHS